VLDVYEYRVIRGFRVSTAIDELPRSILSVVCDEQNRPVLVDDLL